MFPAALARDLHERGTIIDLQVRVDKWPTRERAIGRKQRTGDTATQTHTTNTTRICRRASGPRLAT